MATNYKADIGTAGEKAAVKHLRERGFLIHALNWRDGRYELDIVAERFGIMHFVEVKTRSVFGFTSPEDAMTRDKRKAFNKAAQLYIKERRIRNEIQFDLVAVDVEEDNSFTIRHIERIM